MQRVQGWRDFVVAAVVVALVSTFADAFSAAALAATRSAYRLAHGLVVFTSIGYVLARLGEARKAWLGAVAGLLTGVAAVAVFYVLFAWLGTAAIVLVWIGAWLTFAFLRQRLASRPESLTLTLARGLAAALMSAVAFWALAGVWLGSNAAGPLYIRHFAAWLVGLGPGFAALLLRRR